MLFHSKKKHTIKIKKRRNSSEPIIPGLCTSLARIRKTNCERAALYISLKKMKEGSLTVEAAIILPLFLMAMLTIICVVDLCKLHVEEQTRMMEKAKKLSAYAYTGESYLEDAYIDLYQVKACELPVSLIPGYRLNLALRGRVRAWTGRSKAECEADKKDNAAKLVYVTENGEVFHTDHSCTYLDLSIYGVEKGSLLSARNKDGSRYKSCEKCCSVSDTVDIYYISASGEKHHTSNACSGLTRKVHMVRRSEVSHLPECSRCQGG